MNTRPNFKDNIISQNAPMEVLSPEVFDRFLADGWRLLGYCLIRHNITYHDGDMCGTIPLRIRMQDWQPNKRQRKLLRQNEGLRTEVQAIQITPRTLELFARHSERHRYNKPSSLYSFLSENAHQEPVQGLEFRVFQQNIHVASSFIHLGERAMSGTYCVFDPDFSALGLGTYTMLLELEYARQNGYEYYYHGYVHDVPSSFDYKWRFEALESYDWEAHQWQSV